MRYGPRIPGPHGTTTCRKSLFGLGEAQNLSGENDERTRRCYMGCSKREARATRAERSRHGLRRDRLLIGNERGSAPLEAIFSVALLLVLVFGLIQVAFVLYGRNVVISSAHEGARAAIELGGSTSEAAAVATSTVRSATGHLVDSLDVDVAVTHRAERAVVSVSVSGSLDAFGPIPVTVPISVSATSVRDETLR